MQSPGQDAMLSPCTTYSSPAGARLLLDTPPSTSNKKVTPQLMYIYPLPGKWV